MRPRRGFLQEACGALVMAAFVLQVSSASSSCRTNFDLDGVVRTYSKCANMVTQEHTVSIAWSHQPSNSILDVAFSGDLKIEGGWLGWGVNSKCRIMAETSAMIAFQAFNGSTLLPYRLGHILYRKEDAPPLKSSAIDLRVLDKAVLIVGSTVTMFLTIKLEPEQTRINQVWAQGYFVKDFVPSGPCNFESHNVATLDVNQGVMDYGVRRKCADPNSRVKTVHMLLTLFGYGLLYPLATILSYSASVSETRGPKFYTIVLVKVYMFQLLCYYSGLNLHDDEISPKASNEHGSSALAVLVMVTIQVVLTIAQRVRESIARRTPREKQGGEREALLTQVETKGDDQEDDSLTFVFLAANLFLVFVTANTIRIAMEEGMILMGIEIWWRRAYKWSSAIGALIPNIGGLHPRVIQTPDDSKLQLQVDVHRVETSPRTHID